MKCNIEYIGETESGIAEYYCSTHKCFASDDQGKKLEECLSPDKEMFDNQLDLKVNRIDSIKLVYSNILDNIKPQVFINNEPFYGVLTYNNSILTYKDLGGLMLSRINYLSFKEIKCKHCHHYHTDNGKFAYTPHRTHLCQYCGRLFRDEEKSIGNELTIVFDIPDIRLEDKTINIDDICQVEYDILKGQVLINNQNVDNLLINDEEISLKTFLNNKLQEEY